MEHVFYDAVVIGGGHAAIEAGCAIAKKGHPVLMLVLDLDSIGYLACNPSIGGTSKGNLVKEIDALGGVMPGLADASLIQLRMLNESKGVAVQSLRAQIDKHEYHTRAKQLLESTPLLTLRQAEATDIQSQRDGTLSVSTARGETFFCRTCIVATGVYLRSNIIVGDRSSESGPAGFARSTELSGSLERLGHTLRRFKTGTPPRIDGRTADKTKFELQRGADVPPFSVLTKKTRYDLAPCYLGYTNAQTHDVIRQNLHLSAMYSGLIHGTGARYCPSIEDKIIRFADKPRHQFFLEPEGLSTSELYVQGISTSMPAAVQTKILRSIPGLERVHIMRDAYAIEYDCIDSLSLKVSLESKLCQGLYFAGQINGTSGYEEAAAQGLLAGINAALSLEGDAPLVLTRFSSYIGVLIDDLVTKGTNEPYRMMTSRAEHRLKLRQSNSDLRLTQIGRDIGLVGDRQYKLYKKKLRQIETLAALAKTVLPPSALAPVLLQADEPFSGQAMALEDLFKRPGVTAEIAATLPMLAEFSKEAVAEVCYECKYRGYLVREERAIQEAMRLEGLAIPEAYDYLGLKGVRIEARQKLDKIRPATIGAASRISGVNPADITVLLLSLRQKK